MVKFYFAFKEHLGYWTNNLLMFGGYDTYLLAQGPNWGAPSQGHS